MMSAVAVMFAVHSVLTAPGGVQPEGDREEGRVTLRRGEAPPPGVVIGVDLEGVTIEDGAENRAVVGWHRVRSVSGEFAEAAEAFMPIAEDAWRAKARLERGDTLGAEPILERLAPIYEGRSGPTAAMLAEGLLLTKLQRGARVAAVRAWSGLLDAHQGVIARAFEGSAVVDLETGLVPGLPPIWLDWPAVQAFAGLELGSSDTLGGRYLELYRAAARYECGWDGALDGIDRRASSRGLQIVRQIVIARAGSGLQRAEARGWLEAQIGEATPAWLEAWLRCAIGRSLVLEGDPELRKLGVIELLHIPARLDGVHPYLAGLALGECVVALDQLGLTESADDLHETLLDQHPNHPALEWPPVRDRNLRSTS